MLNVNPASFERTTILVILRRSWPGPSNRDRVMADSGWKYRSSVQSMPRRVRSGVGIKGSQRVVSRLGRVLKDLFAGQPSEIDSDTILKACST